MSTRGPAVAVVALAAVALVGSAPAADARNVTQWHQVAVYSPANVDANVGWLAQQMFDLKKPARIRVGSTTYVGPWNNATITRGTMTEALKELGRRYSSDNIAVYSDRRLTAAERARYRIGAELYRDADVLVLKAGHPGCNGLTLAQARGIAGGRITRWSQVVSGVDGAIAVRYPQQRSGFSELRFGTRLIQRRTSKGIRYRASYAKGARGVPDGGIAAAASDLSIAAISSWSKAGARGGATCIVPLGGVAASASSVAALRYPSAYPVDVVVRRRIGDAYLRKLVAAFSVYMRSAKVRDKLRGRGLLVAGDPPPADAPQGVGEAAAPLYAP